VFGELTEHAKVLHEHVESLTDSVGELGSGLAELLPMFAGLGAAGTLAGLFELSHSAFERVHPSSRPLPLRLA